jgi:hypothetical protein
MAIIKKSKKTVLGASFLILLLSTTFVALQITPASSTGVHDVAISNVELLYNTTVTYPTWPLEIYVTVKNNGDFPETFTQNVWIAPPYPITELDKIVENLVPEESRTLTFNWTVPSIDQKWPYDNSTIYAWTSSITNETNRYDNEFIRKMTIRWPGDADGDGHVNQTDLDIVVDYYGRPNNEFPSANYTTLVDFNGDGEITIVDVSICGLNYYEGPCDWHDVAVTGIVPVTYPTWNDDFYLTFGVTVQNKGWHYPETFYVTIYNGTNFIDTKTVTNLASRAERLITFTLEGHQSLPGYPDNSSAVGQYPTHTIRAEASTVSGEYDTTDNTHDNVTVTVRWPGDANGDRHINQADKDIVSYSLGKEFPDPNYTASADFNIDGIINATDLEILENETHWHNGPIDYCDLAVTINHIVFQKPPIQWRVWNPSIVYPSWPLEIDVTVKNNGNNTETEFTLTAYANTIVMGTKDFNVNLAPGASENVSFTGIVPSLQDPPPEWSYPYPIYNLTVRLTLPCDDNPDNDEDSYGIVTVWCPGDTNGDGYLDEDDLSTLSSAIDNYDWHADFNGNGEIDLDDVQQLISDDRWRKGPRPPDPDPAKKKL